MRVRLSPRVARGVKDLRSRFSTLLYAALLVPPTAVFPPPCLVGQRRNPRVTCPPNFVRACVLDPLALSLALQQKTTIIDFVMTRINLKG